MCEKPEPPENVDITEGQNRTADFNSLLDKMLSVTSGDDKPTPPPNTSTTKDGGNTDRPTSPPNQEITKGDK